MRNRSFSQPFVSARGRPMLAVAAAALLVAAAMPSAVVAEDEDSSTQVYLVFDPETGEFIKSHDPDAALPPQTGLGSTAPADPDASGGSSSGSSTSMMAAIAAALLIAGGAGFTIMRLRRNPG